MCADSRYHIFLRDQIFYLIAYLDNNGVETGGVSDPDKEDKTP